MAFLRISFLYLAACGAFVLSCLAVFLFLRGGEQDLPFPSVWNKHSSVPPFSQVLYIGTQKYALEIADTEAEREKGLSGRESLCERCGMLFVFEAPGRYAFWMKDMRFPLDIVWLSGETVVFVARDIQPDLSGVIDPPVSADRVLEINASMAQSVNIGDSLWFVRE